MADFSIEKKRNESTGKRMCKRHGKNLKKHMLPSGEIVWTCPREKCGYKEDDKGEML